MKKQMSGSTDAVVLVAAMLMLAGCSSSVPGWQLDQFVQKCAARGGIHAIDTRIPIDAICRDGMRVDYERPAK